MAEKYKQKYLKYKTKYLLLKQQLNQLEQSGHGFNYLKLQNDIKALNLNSIEVYGSKKKNSIYVKFNNSQYKLRIENNNDTFIATLYLESIDGIPVKNVIGLSSDEGIKFTGNKQKLLEKIIEINAQLNVKQNNIKPNDIKQNDIKQNDKVLALLTPISSQAGLFFEKQEGSACGRHALNNLFQMQKFIRPKTIPETYTKEKIIELASNPNKQIDLNSFCRFLYYIRGGILSLYENDYDYCVSDENYDINVLTEVLKLLHHNVVDYDMSNRDLIDYPDTFGYLLNLNNGYHWTSIKKNDSSYVYYESRDSGPKYFDDLNKLNLFLQRGRNGNKKFNGRKEEITAIKRILLPDLSVNFNFDFIL